MSTSRIHKAVSSISRIDKEQGKSSSFAAPKGIYVSPAYHPHNHSRASSRENMASKNLNPREKEMFENVPPHFGKL
ncbi:MAG: hypothetical protein J6M18_04740 [Actinomycetaceae bacterium]|nr:hypothetical protein [Actinomycetaceae bacterium]